MTEPRSPLNPKKPAKPGRRLFEAGAAVIGVGAGVAFAEPVLAAAGSVWNGFVLPAYQAMIDNGLMAWCF
jgi:hypothetical protein